MKFVCSLLNLLLVASCSAFLAPQDQKASLFGFDTGHRSNSCRFSAVAEAPTDEAPATCTSQKIRNVAVIAHVDHGKTTL